MYSVANSGGKLSEATHFKNFAYDGRGISCAQGVAEPSLAADGPGLVERLEKASLNDLGKQKREVTLSAGCLEEGKHRHKVSGWEPSRG